MAALGLALTSGAAIAEQSALAPLTDVAQLTSSTEEVKRDKTKSLKGFGDVDLKAASVADVDANGDGQVSFEELLAFDIKSF